jgi:hypothetical protein
MILGVIFATALFAAHYHVVKHNYIYFDGELAIAVGGTWSLRLYTLAYNVLTSMASQEKLKFEDRSASG